MKMLRLILHSLLVCSLFFAAGARAAQEVVPLPIIAQEEVEKLTIDQLQARGAKGDLKAKAELGARYARGAGVPVDMKKAIPLFEQAAKKEEPNGQYYLGTAYNMGMGVKQDAAQAAHWFGKAAAHNHAGGQFALGVMMTDGQGGLKADPQAAVALILKAAEQGFVPAAYQMSQLYIGGIGVEKDTEKAAGWLRRILKSTEYFPAAASLTVLIETKEATWQPGDPGAPPPVEAAVAPNQPVPNGSAQQAAALAGAPSATVIKRAPGPRTTKTFKTVQGITLEARARDGFLGVYSTSKNPYRCEIFVKFTYLAASGVRTPGDYLCYKQDRPAGNKVAACESSHRNFNHMSIEDVQITTCDELPAK